MPPNQPTDQPTPRWRVPAVAVGIGVLACLPFLRLLDAGFVNWDDDHNFVNNPAYRGLGLEQLRWMFTTFHYGGYQPLSWLSAGIDFTLWGMDPRGYHLTNLLLHACNAVALFGLTLALLGQRAAGGRTVWAAAGAALLFAVHPLRVESVAWLTERRGLLAALFAMLSVLCYLRARVPGGRCPRRYFALAVLAFVLSLLAKVQTILLPAVLLVLDACPLGRFGSGGPGVRRLLVEKIPFLLVAAGVGVLARLAQAGHGATYSWHDYGLTGRLAQVAYSVWFYLVGTVYPSDLCVLHPLQAAPSWGEPRFAAAGIALVVVTALLIAWRRRLPALLTAWLAYGLLLAPVSGLAQAGPSLVAERYAYLPTIGFFVLLGQGLRLAPRWGVPGRAVAAVVLALAVVLGALSHDQCRHWRTSADLWRRAIAVHPDAVYAHLNLGAALETEARTAGDAAVAARLGASAAGHYRAAAAAMPSFGTAHYHLGLVQFRSGDHAGARTALQRAHDLYDGGFWTSRPSRVELTYMLGVADSATGHDAAAEQRLRAAIALDRSYVHSYPVLADVLVRRGRRAAAIELLEGAVRAVPGDRTLREKLASLRR